MRLVRSPNWTARYQRSVRAPFHMKRSYHQPHNWPAEKVAPLVRRLPKTQQTVLGQCKDQTKAHLWSTSFC